MGWLRRSINWCRVKDLRLQPPRSERGASASWANAAKLVHPAGLSPADSPFEAECDCNFTTDAGEKAEGRMKNPE
jgi:hypothetical protein